MKTPTEIANEIKQHVDALRELIKTANGVFYVTINSTDGSFRTHEWKSYAEASQVLRELGCNKREKRVCDSKLTVLDGSIETIHYTLYVNDLPPTCHVEEVIERVPKTEVRTIEGDFVEIKRLKVVCGTPADEV